MKKFNTFDEVSGLKMCKKLPVVVLAKKMDEDFIVQTLEGTHS
jgi:hypothetical protein